MSLPSRPTVRGLRRQRGWTLPITAILVLIVVILYLSYGVKVLAWVGAGVVGITLLVWVYDGIARQFPSGERFHPFGKQCLRCGAVSMGQFVHDGRYELRCTECGEVFFRGTLSRAVEKLGGNYEAVVVDSKLAQQRVVASGTLRRMQAQLRRESDAGRRILLRAASRTSRSEGASSPG